MISLHNKVAVITGGARGIGREIAVCFAENGADIALIDLREQEMSVTASMVEELGKRVLTLRLDVRHRAQMQLAAEKVNNVFDKVDILVTSAGIAQSVPSLDMNEQDWADMINTTLSGTFWACQAFGRDMCDRGSGKIIMIGSKSGLIVNRGAEHAHYNASKAAVIHLAKCLAAEWAPSGVYVNCISPGYTLTDMTKDRIEEHGTWISRIPIGRLALPEDLRGAALYLASDQSNFTTGLNLVVDGGYTLW
jgi:NAD(P)-dependent dehydrogenase (short-subunit alcohol dehydrogenase family)